MEGMMLTGTWSLEGAQQRLHIPYQGAQNPGLRGALFLQIKGCRPRYVFLVEIQGGLKFPLAQCSVKTEGRKGS